MYMYMELERFDDAILVDTRVPRRVDEIGRLEEKVESF